MYSTPKYNANVVNIKTREDATSARISTQKTICMSTISKQKNHLPKSIKKYVPVSSTKYNSFNVKKRTKVKVITDPQNVPIGPSHLLNKKINKQCIIRNIGANDIKFVKKNIEYNILYNYVINKINVVILTL